MLTAHLFLYLGDFGTALSTQSYSFSIVLGRRNLPSAMAKTDKMQITSSSHRFWNTNLVQRESIG